MPRHVRKEFMASTPDQTPPPSMRAPAPPIKGPIVSPMHIQTEQSLSTKTNAWSAGLLIILILLAAAGVYFFWYKKQSSSGSFRGNYFF